MDISIVFCVEPGYLTSQATLLVQSLRKWGGAFSNVRLLAIQPRATGLIPESTLRVFAEHEVEFISRDLNRDFRDSPWANKVFACALAETIVNTEYLMFTDTDCVFLNAIDETLLASGENLGLQPVVEKFRGTSHLFDGHAGMWRRMYKRAGIRPEGYVRTSIDEVRIRPYYNAGIAVFRRSQGIAQVWLEMLRLIDDVVYPEARNNLDQFALALAASKVGGVKILPKNYNFNIGRRASYGSPWSAADLDQLVHVHYHGDFFVPRFLEDASPPFDRNQSRFDWLNQRLPLLR